MRHSTCVKFSHKIRVEFFILPHYNNHMKRFLSFILLAFLFLSGIVKQTPASAANAVEISAPRQVIQKYFHLLQRADFDSAESFCTGAMLKWINDIKRFLLEAPPAKIESFKAKYRLLKSIRFYHELIQGKYAFIYSLWIYNAPPQSMFFYKIHDNIYLLEKINENWLIKNVRFNGEHVLYDKEKARQIEQEAIRQENLRNRRRTR